MFLSQSRLLEITSDVCLLWFFPTLFLFHSHNPSHACVRLARIWSHCASTHASQLLQPGYIREKVDCREIHTRAGARVKCVCVCVVVCNKRKECCEATDHWALPTVYVFIINCTAFYYYFFKSFSCYGPRVWRHMSLKVDKSLLSLTKKGYCLFALWWLAKGAVIFSITALPSLGDSPP